MPYLECNSTSFSLNCFKASPPSATSVQWMPVKIVAGSIAPLAFLHCLIWLTGQRIRQQPKSPDHSRSFQHCAVREKRQKFYTIRALAVTFISIVVALVLIALDIKSTRGMPFGKGQTNGRSLAFQLAIFGDIILGGALAVVLTPRLKRRMEPASEDWNPVVWMLKDEGPENRKVVWRLMRLQRHALMAVIAAAVAGYWTGELVLRLLAGLLTGSVIGEWVEGLLWFCRRRKLERKSVQVIDGKGKSSPWKIPRNMEHLIDSTVWYVGPSGRPVRMLPNVGGQPGVQVIPLDSYV